MAFFRIKKIKGNEYVYLVENEWKKKSSRQKVKGYIGRAHRFSMKNDVNFLEHFKINDSSSYVDSNEQSKIMHDLIEWEFLGLE